MYQRWYPAEAYTSSLYGVGGILQKLITRILYVLDTPSTIAASYTLVVFILCGYSSSGPRYKCLSIKPYCVTHHCNCTTYTLDIRPYWTILHPHVCQLKYIGSLSGPCWTLFFAKTSHILDSDPSEYSYLPCHHVCGKARYSS